MFKPEVVLTFFCLYMFSLFLIALWVERKSLIGKSPANNPLVYSLSLAVYCTAWTYYGSVGKAATSGMLFLAIYLGPTLAIFLSWIILRKMVRLKTTHRITSIADFISVRYNKSQPLAALVTIIALVGSMPYIALQLKAVISTFGILTVPMAGDPLAADLTALSWIDRHVGPLVVALMILFTIILGVRRLDPTERHEGMMTALAVECLVKLVAFLAAGIFVTYFIYDGLGDIFFRLSESPFQNLTEFGGEESSPYLTWMSYLILSMSAILFLPRQFHVAVVENSDEKHIRTAMWLFPVYMLLINIFVFPIAVGGLLKGYPVQEADTFVLSLPLRHGAPWLTLLVFIGGVSAAAGMIMISSMTMSIMITNHLMLPFVGWFRRLDFLKHHILRCRWAAVAGFILIGYWFEERIGESYMLVNIGLISFAAVLQFAPATLGGLFWRQGNKTGAILGLSTGFLIWGYTLLLPSFIKSGWMPYRLIEDGPWGIEFLKPEQLFGLQGFDPLSHTVFWTLLFNSGLYVLGSLYFERSPKEQSLAEEFVGVMEAAIPLHRAVSEREAYIDVKSKKKEIEDLLSQYFSRAEAEMILEKGLSAAGIGDENRISIVELVELHSEVEKSLAGSIGSAAAHKALREGILFTPREARELSEIYGEILVDLKVTPTDLKRRIDYYQEKEMLLTRQAAELEEKIKEREREIAKRREAEEALRESEERYRSLVENIDLGIALIDTDHTVLMTNSALCRLFRKTNCEIEGRECYKVFCNHQTPCPNCPGMKAMTTGQSEEIDIEGVREDGSRFPLRVRVFPVRKSDGTLSGFIEVLEDITERKLAEEERVRLATAVEQAAESIIITQKDGTIQYVNPAFERISGYSREEIIGKNPRILKDEEQNDALYQDMWETLTRKEIWTGHFVNRRKDGGLYEVETTVSPIRDESGNIINYVSVGRDVTQVVRLEKQLRQAQKMEAIGTLAGGIAHDFNNILTIILGYTEMALEDIPEGSSLKEDLQEVLRASYRARSLVEQILTFSRQTEQERKPLQVGPIIKEAIKLLRASLPSTIETRQDIDTEGGMVLADPTQIHQIIMNLCTNAAHAMREKGGVLEISLAEVNLDRESVVQYPDLKPGPYLRLTVSDTGHGMRRDVMERIFDPFFTTKGAGEGTGLGLAVVYGIVKNYGGAITVYSEQGKGTAFHILLPRIEGEVIPEAEISEPLPTGNERILFVDDEKSLLQMGQKMLERLGYQVFPCSDSVRALDLFREKPDEFDLVITDQTMPGMTGTELASELLRIRPDIPIILCTGFSQLVNQEKAELMGIREFVMKPIVKHEIAKAIRKALAEEQKT